jgi:hypothetical protein
MTVASFSIGAAASPSGGSRKHNGASGRQFFDNLSRYAGVSGAVTLEVIPQSGRAEGPQAKPRAAAKALVLARFCGSLITPRCERSGSLEGYGHRLVSSAKRVVCKPRKGYNRFRCFSSIARARKSTGIHRSPPIGSWLIDPPFRPKTFYRYRR